MAWKRRVFTGGGGGGKLSKARGGWAEVRREAGRGSAAPAASRHRLRNSPQSRREAPSLRGGGEPNSASTFRLFFLSCPCCLDGRSNLKFTSLSKKFPPSTLVECVQNSVCREYPKKSSGLSALHNINIKTVL